MDPEKPCCKPSWGESLKVSRNLCKSCKVHQMPSTQDFNIANTSWQAVIGNYVVKSLGDCISQSVSRERF